MGLDFFLSFGFVFIRSILNFTVCSSSHFILILILALVVCRFLPKRFAYLPCLLCYFIVKFMHGCDFDVVFIQHTEFENLLRLQAKRHINCIRSKRKTSL